MNNETYKILLKNLPLYSNATLIKKYLLKNNLINQNILNLIKIKKPPKKKFGWIKFDDENEMKLFYNKYQELYEKYKNMKENNDKELDIKFQHFLLKNKLIQIEISDHNNLQNQKLIQNMNEIKIPTLLEKVTPYWNIPYIDQLNKKEKKFKKNCILKMFKRLDKNWNEAINRWEKEDNSKRSRNRPKWLEHFSKTRNFSFNVLPILYSNNYNNYRNKVEYTFGTDIKTNQPMCGFRLLGYMEGNLRVGNVNKCLHIDDRMKEIANILTNFLLTSKYQPYNDKDQSGVWRFALVRTTEKSTTNEMIIKICVKNDHLSYNEWNDEKNRLKDLILNISNNNNILKDTNIKCLCILPYSGTSVPDPEEPYEILFGEPFITEYLLGKKFQINIDAFFQVNHDACEILYQRVIDHLTYDNNEFNLKFNNNNNNNNKLNDKNENENEEEIKYNDNNNNNNNNNNNEIKINNDNDNDNENEKEEEINNNNNNNNNNNEITLLDICCGTGTIGICSTNTLNIKNVIGIELIEAATIDAENNAILNNLNNCHFICSKAELVLNNILNKEPRNDKYINKENNKRQKINNNINNIELSNNIVAIVDPPRAGLHPDCLRAIRSCEPIKKLIYVSCNPNRSFVNDSEVLCGPNSKRVIGEPFTPIFATPVDLFPHTDHCELVMVFER